MEKETEKDRVSEIQNQVEQSTNDKAETPEEIEKKFKEKLESMNKFRQKLREIKNKKDTESEDNKEAKKPVEFDIEKLKEVVSQLLEGKVEILESEIKPIGNAVEIRAKLKHSVGGEFTLTGKLYNRENDVVTDGYKISDINFFKRKLIEAFIPDKSGLAPAMRKYFGEIYKNKGEIEKINIENGKLKITFK